MNIEEFRETILGLKEIGNSYFEVRTDSINELVEGLYFELTALRAERDRYRAALEWYANEKSYSAVVSYIEHFDKEKGTITIAPERFFYGNKTVYTSPIDEDNGAKAREALNAT